MKVEYILMLIGAFLLGVFITVVVNEEELRKNQYKLMECERIIEFLEEKKPMKLRAETPKVLKLEVSGGNCDYLNIRQK